MNVDINNTPFMQGVNQMFPECVQMLLNRGVINQAEYNQLTMAFPSLKMVYVQRLLGRYNQMTTEQLRNDLLGNFIQKQIDRMRCTMGGGMYSNSGMNGMLGNPMAMNGGYGSQMTPAMLQQDGAIGNGMQANYYQQPIQQAAPIRPTQPIAQPAKPVQQPVKQVATNWKAPEIDTLVQKKTFEMPENSSLSVASKRFIRSNGRRHLEVFAIENSVKYTTAEEVYKMVKSLPNLFNGVDSYTISVGYLEPVLMEVGMKELTALANEFHAELTSDTGSLKRNGSVMNISPLFKITDKYSTALSREFMRVLVDEFNVHQNSGELCDAKHMMPFIDIDDLHTIEGYASRIGIGDIDKDCNEIVDFDAKLAVVIEKAITPYIVSLKNFIVDPKASITNLDTYCKVVPRFITKDGVGYAAVPDLMKLFATSKEHVSGTPSSRAKQAKIDFDATLEELTSRFTVVYRPRVVTFCNLDPALAIGYNDQGVTPRHYEKATNDVSYFLLAVLGTFASMQSKLFSCATFKCLFENDELKTDVLYGVAADDGLWTGNEQYL